MQQLLLGLKRENKDNLELVQKEHDEALFKFRGEQAISVEYYVEKIQALEDQLQNLNKPGNKKKSFILNDDENQVQGGLFKIWSDQNLHLNKYSILLHVFLHQDRNFGK